MKAKYCFLILVIFSLFTAAVSVFGQEQTNILDAGYYLPPGAELVSPNGKYNLIYQKDGNLVLYGQNRKVIWASNTDQTGEPDKSSMEKGGNFVLYNNNGLIVWATETDKNGPNCFVQLNDDGGFEVIKKGGINEVLYSSIKAGWGWKKPVTGEVDNWEVDMSFNYLAPLDNISDKSIKELEKMYFNGEGYCGRCIAVEVANMYWEKGDQKNALKWLEKASNEGYARAKYQLANIYYKGIGTAVNYKKALSLYKFIADLNKDVRHISGLGENYSNVQNRIAGFYFFGYGVPKDVSKAKALLKDAMDSGSAAAKDNWDKYFSSKQDTFRR